jgi:hypothetical protein
LGSAEDNKRNTVNSDIMAVKIYEDTLYHVILWSIERERERERGA